MRTGRMVKMMGWGLLGVSAYAAFRENRRRSRDTVQAKPEAVQRWEGEGGGVPVSSHRMAAQVNPDDDASAEIGTAPS
jgi:hypothetical protein